MLKFEFQGGAKLVDRKNYKFHVFVVDTDANEHHLFGAIKNGLVTATRDLSAGYEEYYSTSSPILKVFSATSGFGIAKEYFSYFIKLDETSTKMISIQPLGYRDIPNFNWRFRGQGRFLVKEEIRRFFGVKSDTWKFYTRQTFLSRSRLQSLVEVKDVNQAEDQVNQVGQVRMLRFD
jgi:hypothetical protein